MKQRFMIAHASAIAVFLASTAFSQQLLAEGEEGLPDGVTLEEAVESPEEAAQRMALESIASNRDQVVAELLATFGSETDEVGAQQLEISLLSATTEQLLAAQNAQSVDEVNDILAGTVSGDLDGVAAVDFASLEFTPVTPCRIVDTTKVGGAFSPLNTREFYVYGSLSASQGGSTCNSPVGEPLGVMLNITAVPKIGNGNVVVYPANVSAPLASTVNYRTGVQNIANASSVKTYAAGGNKDIEILNRGGTAHLVIDVLGYYSLKTKYNNENLSTSTITTISTSSSSPTEIRESYVYNRDNSFCQVSATIGTYTSGTNYFYCNLIQDTDSTPNAMTTPYYYDYHSTGVHNTNMSITRSFYHEGGTGKYYRLQCYKNTGTGVRYVYYPTLTANCSAY